MDTQYDGGPVRLPGLLLVDPDPTARATLARGL